MNTKHPCPECGEPPTDESLAEQHLSTLGYMHDDRFCECDNGHSWTVGIPKGTNDNDSWNCEACGGNFIPHFMYIDESSVKIRPKCASCYWVPDEPIELPQKSTGNHEGRVFFEHHLVTGKTTDNVPHK